jgi:DNA-binding LytR/AlgR family response regulator
MKNEVKIVGNNLLVAYNGIEIFCPLSNINYCEAICRSCEIYYNEDKHQKAYIGINKLYSLLPRESFYMCHRLWIIHLGILKEATIKDNEIVFHDQKMPVSRYKFVELQLKAIAYLSGSA